VRVIDLSRVLAGPYCAMVLADLGADVVKVEPPGGDETRRWGPPFAGDTAAYFFSANRNKRSVVLDLKGEADQLRLGRLVAQADVVVHNYTDRVSAQLGIDHRWLTEHNPECVVCRISGFGEASNRPAYDLVLQAASGLMSITGQPGGEPTKVGVAVADVVAGLFAAVGVLAQLYARRDGGRLMCPCLTPRWHCWSTRGRPGWRAAMSRRDWATITPPSFPMACLRRARGSSCWRWEMTGSLELSARSWARPTSAGTTGLPAIPSGSATGQNFARSWRPC
jgi:hypothetical protein